MFTEATDPLDAGSWLCTTEAKFSLLCCLETQKTLFMAQQLRGSVSAWWATFTATHPDGYHVSWAEFREAFQGHHIPDGLMDCKQQEFLDLKQGPNTVYEDCKRFIYLAQYGMHHIDTDAKKIALFHKGLCSKIHEQLMPFHSWTFNQLMSGSIRQENAIRAPKEEKRGKRAAPGPFVGAPPKYRLVYTTPVG
jgi:hypothetical protein